MFKELNHQSPEGADGSIVFEGAHDGYRRLRGRPVHHRRIVWAGDVVAIEDRIEGGGVHAIESRLHIHPNLKVEPADSGVRISAKGRLIMFVSPTGQGTVETGAGWHCTEFNRKVSCTVLRLKSNSAALPVGFDWEFRLCQGR